MISRFRYKVCSLSRLVFLLFIILMSSLAISLNVVYTVEGGTAGWIVRSNPSRGDDYAYAVCKKGNYVYIVGVSTASDGYRFRIEKRYKVNGELVHVWTHNLLIDDGKIYDCIIVNDKIYVAGHYKGSGDAEWVILALDLDLNLLTYATSNPSSESDKAFGITSDGEYLYIVGYEYGGEGIFDYGWRVEKRTLNNLSLVGVYRSNPSEMQDFAYSIGINPVTGNIWVIGFDWIDPVRRWRIEILCRHNLSLAKVVRLEISPLSMNEDPYSISFDEEGNAIIAGSGGVVIVNEEGDVLALSAGYYWYYKALYFNSHIYVVGRVCEEGKLLFFIPYLECSWQLCVLNLNLSLVRKIFLGRADVEFSFGRLSIESDNVYFAGSARARQEPFDWEWAIYSISSTNMTIFAESPQIYMPRWILEILELMAGGFLGIFIGMLIVEIDFLRTIVGSALCATLAHLIKLKTAIPEWVPLGFISLLMSILFFGSREDLKVAYLGALAGSLVFIGAGDAKLIEGATIGAAISLLLWEFFRVFIEVAERKIIQMGKRSSIVRDVIILALCVAMAAVVVAVEIIISDYIGTLFVDLLIYNARPFTLALFVTLLTILGKIRAKS